MHPTRLVASILAVCVPLAACDGPATGVEAPRATGLALASPAVPAAEVGTVLDPLVIRVTDQRGSPMAGVPMSLAVLSGGGSVTPANGTSGGDGTLTVTWTMGPDPVENQLEARAEGVAPLRLSLPAWRLSTRSVAFTALGDSMRLEVELGGGEPHPLDLRLQEDRRWLSEVPVLDANALARGILRSAGAGSATVRVQAAGVQMGTVEVGSAPDAPLVFSVTQPGLPADPTIILRGYAMDGVPPDAVRVGGALATPIGSDSASLRLRADVVESEACVLSLPAEVGFSGTASLWSGTVQRPTPRTSLGVAETRTFEGRSLCLRLETEPGARYALAQVDRYLVDRARTAAEPYWDTLSHPPHRFTVSTATAGSAAGSARAPALPGRTRGLAPVEHVAHLRAGADLGPASTWDRVEPWAVGDTFTAVDRGVIVQWRVMRTYAPNVAFAIARPDSALLWHPGRVAIIDSTFHFLATEAAQERFRLFGASPPFTSPESGQLLVLLREVSQSGVSNCRFGPGSGMSSQISLGTPALSVGHTEPFLRTVAHEITHSWHCTHRRLSGARWAVEGVANLIAAEHLLAWLRIERDGNHPWQSWNSGFVSQGHFTNGYVESEWFLAHAALRLSRVHGVPWSAALGAVVLGATEGWHGWSSPHGPGITERMRALGDPEWDAVDARLDWVLSVAVDDRAGTGAEGYGFALLQNAWTPVEAAAGTNLWGIGFYRGVLDAEHDTVEGSGFPGGNGYVLLEDAGAPVALHAESDLDTMVWRILRFR